MASDARPPRSTLQPPRPTGSRNASVGSLGRAPAARPGVTQYLAILRRYTCPRTMATVDLSAADAPDSRPRRASAQVLRHCSHGGRRIPNIRPGDRRAHATARFDRHPGHHARRSSTLSFGLRPASSETPDLSVARRPRSGRRYHRPAFARQTRSFFHSSCGKLCEKHADKHQLTAPAQQSHQIGQKLIISEFYSIKQDFISFFSSQNCGLSCNLVSIVESGRRCAKSCGKTLTRLPAAVDVQ